MTQHLPSSPTASHWQRIGIHPHHGIALPLWSLHTKRSPIGEYPDLCKVIDWCKQVGLDTLQLLPLNDTGAQTSPYSARSAFALNPVYLQLDALPEVSADAALREAAQLPAQTGMHLNYRVVREKKRRFMQFYCDKIGQKIRETDAYKSFVAENGWLETYALYKVLKAESAGKHWEDWPQNWQHPSQQLLEQHRAAVNTLIVTQYLCHQQLAQVRAHADQQGINLMGDIPILIDRDSADVWAHPEHFKMNVSAGAPPDPLGPKGQDWGFPPYDWERLEQENYSWWRERLRVAGRYFHLIRIDHIVGFFRIWTIPRGKSSRQGHYEPSEEELWGDHGRKLLTMMIESSPMLPIGEDLGTIPPITRQTMRELGICGTRVMRWEKEWQGDKHYLPLDQYDPLSVTTVSTHDSEPLVTWYQQDPTARQLAPSPRDALEASHRTTSLFHLNLLTEYFSCLEGLSWGDPRAERINIPGTVSETNWSLRLRPSLEEWTVHPDLQKWLQKLSKL
jgi:4-alpha-glucanotransferase